MVEIAFALLFCPKFLSNFDEIITSQRNHVVHDGTNLRDQGVFDFVSNLCKVLLNNIKWMRHMRMYI